MSRTAGDATLGSSQQQDGRTPSNLRNEWRRNSRDESLDGRESFNENLSHFLPLKILARKYKCTHSRSPHSRQLDRPIANSIVLSKDDPLSTPDLPESIFVTCGWWKVVIVNVYLDACLAECGSNGLIAQ